MMQINSGSARQLILTVGDTGSRPGQTIRLGDKGPGRTEANTNYSTAVQFLDAYAPAGYQGGYSVKDAAISLWRQENTKIDLSDPSSLDRLRERVRGGNLSLTPTDQELGAYIENLRKNGLSGKLDWPSLQNELTSSTLGDVSGSAIGAENLADRIDYLASRYAAALDKLERGYSGGELESEKKKLDAAYQAGANKLAEDYTGLLQSALGISQQDAQDVRNSFSALLEQRIEGYRDNIEQVRESIVRAAPEDGWLLNHDAYVAAQLRKTGAGTESGGAVYSAEDLTAAGKIAKIYKSEAEAAAFGSLDEADMALNLAMADMKSEALISRDLVGDKMAALLRNARSQGHSAVLNAADQHLAQREAGRLSGESGFAPMDRTMFQSVYNAVMDTFQKSGDAAAAIRAGASVGKSLTSAAHAASPKVQRWGLGMESYWENFYTTPQRRESNTLQQHIDHLRQQLALPDKSANSTYQNYVNDWQSFLTSIGGGNAAGVNVTA